MFHSIDIVHCQDISLCLEHFGGWLGGNAYGDGGSSSSHDDVVMMTLMSDDDDDNDNNNLSIGFINMQYSFLTG
jgi:hypothetical protein